MQATHIVAIRHGETAWNVDTRIQGPLDIPLNDTGLWQAEQLARALAGEPIAAIYTSDLQRAHATAQAVARTTRPPLTAPPPGAPRGTDPRPPPDRRPRAARAQLRPFPGPHLRADRSRATRRRAALAQARPALCARGRRVTADAARAHRTHHRHPGAAAPGRTNRAGGPRRRARRTLPPGHPPGHTSAPHLATVQRRHQPPAMDPRRPEPHHPAPPPPRAPRQDIQAPRTWQLSNAAINRLLWTPDGLNLIGWADTRHLDDAVRDETNA